MFRAITDFFRRFFNIGRSNAHAALTAAEDPSKMLDLAISDMSGQYHKAREQVAGAIAQEKRLQRELVERQEAGVAWEQKAMIALKSGDEELTRVALQRQADAEAEFNELSAQHDKARAGVESVKNALQSLDKKIEESKRRKRILVARQKRANAQLTINDTLSQLSTDDHGTVFERMEDKITQLESTADAAEEMVALSPGNAENELEEKFKALGAGNTDDRLAALKAKLLESAPEPKALNQSAS